MLVWLLFEKLTFSGALVLPTLTPANCTVGGLAKETSTALPLPVTILVAGCAPAEAIRSTALRRPTDVGANAIDRTQLS